MALADYFKDDALIVDYAEDADGDPDAISIDYLVDGEGDENDNAPSGDRDPLDSELVEGALVFIKGDSAVREFRAWAKSRGYLTSRPWHGEDEVT